MIEVLILYILYKREKTIYSIRKEITELFGMFTKPSIGTIYPALKRLLHNNCVELNERISEGGKKSSYYAITKKGIKNFRDYFFDTASDNPSLFYIQFQIRLATMGLLTSSERKLFVEEYSQKLDIYIAEIERTLNNEFLEHDYYREKVYTRALTEYKSLKDYLINLKVE